MASIFFERKPFPATGCECLSSSILSASEDAIPASLNTCFKCFDLVDAAKSFPYRDPHRPTLARECGCNEVESCAECKDIPEEDIKPEDYIYAVNPFTIIYDQPLVFSITQDGEAATYRTDAYRLLSDEEQCEQADLLMDFLLQTAKDGGACGNEVDLLSISELSLANIVLSEKNLVKLTELLEKLQDLETLRVLIQKYCPVDTVNNFFDVALSLPYLQKLDAEDSEGCFDLCHVLSEVITQSKKREGPFTYPALQTLNLNNALAKFDQEEFEQIILFLEAETTVKDLQVNCNLSITMDRKGFENYSKIPIEGILNALKDNTTVHCFDITASPQFRQYIANLGSRNMLADISKRRRVT